MDELIYSSATTLAQSIRDKKVSSAEVVDAYINRIEEINPKLNCVIQLSDEKARAQAKEADAALARGELKGATSWRTDDRKRLDSDGWGDNHHRHLGAEIVCSAGGCHCCSETARGGRNNAGKYQRARAVSGGRGRQSHLWAQQ